MFEEIGGPKICSAGVSGAGHEAHVGGHFAVSGFALDCASRVMRIPSPFFYAARRRIDVAAEGALVRLRLIYGRRSFLKAIHMVRQKLLCHADVDLSFGLLHQLFPSGMA